MVCASVNAPAADYQKFALGACDFESVGARMSVKLKAIPVPDLKDKSVLDIGCDFGFWCWLAAYDGAAKVVGIDRNRNVRGTGHVDLVAMNNETAKDRGWPCSFVEMDLGKQYFTLGRFDVLFMFSMYHHAYQSAGGDHNPIWYWLKRHIKPGGVLLWENPVSDDDPVVDANVQKEYRNGYTKNAILAAAEKYFYPRYIGPALHEETREVWEFRPKEEYRAKLYGFIEDGEKGATKAFAYANNRRMGEIRSALGFTPYPGSLNIRASVEFPWEENYFRALMLDVVDRENGLAGTWAPRWMRYYPMKANGAEAYALRFEGEEYAPNFVELISEAWIPTTRNPIWKSDVIEPWSKANTGERATRVEMVLEK